MGWVGVVVALGAILPSLAGATILRCGQTITRNTTLSRGIGPCAGSGVVIGANNITLNLGGHTIRGQSFPNSGPPPPSGAGVMIGAHHGVTVEHGTVSGYVTWAPFHGIAVARDGIRAGAPAAPEGGKPTFASRNRVLAITTSDQVKMIGDHNLIGTERSGPTQAFIRVQGQGNHVTLGGTGGDCRRGLAGPGLNVELDGSHNVIDDTHACRIEIAFFLGSGGEDNTVRGNSVVGGPIVSEGGEIGADGRYVSISGERIIGNRVRDKLTFAGEIGGIDLFDTRASLVSGNHLLYSGISLVQSFSDIGRFGPLYPSIDRNRLVYNDVKQVKQLSGGGGQETPGDGIDIPGPTPNGATLYPGARQTQLRHNTTDANAHDGIDNRAPTTSFYANVANHNTNLGIESVANASDLGANRASGNGNPVQCTHVRCHGTVQRQMISGPLASA